MLIGDEFKFVLNDFPDVYVGRNAVAPTATKTVKMRIYKIYVQKTREWEEHEILRDIFEVGTDSEQVNNQEAQLQQQPSLYENGVNQMDTGGYGSHGFMQHDGYPQTDSYGMYQHFGGNQPSERSIHQEHH